MIYIEVLGGGMNISFHLHSEADRDFTCDVIRAVMHKWDATDLTRLKNGSYAVDDCTKVKKRARAFVYLAVVKSENQDRTLRVSVADNIKVRGWVRSHG